MKLRRTNAGFTLAEVLVASGALVLVLGVLLGMTNETQRLVRGTTSKIEQFQEARLAFESMTRRISQATLNTYLDYQFQQVTQGMGPGAKTPSRYQRGSDLRFRSGRMNELIPRNDKRFFPTHGIFFQAPGGQVDNPEELGGLNTLLNTCGYFVELATDEDSLPRCLQKRVAPRTRFRLMETVEVAEKLSVYQFQQPRVNDWFAPLCVGPHRQARAVSENVVALVILPHLSQIDEDAQRKAGRSAMLAPGYRYDSTASAADPSLNPKNQLPPLVQVVMVAIDEPSAIRLETDFKNQAALGLDYGKLFTRPELLDDDPASEAAGDGDLAKFEKMLTLRGVTHRTFSMNVSIRGAKWSRSQEN
jgi:uncharacterized protein (TIGR02599 family)